MLQGKDMEYRKRFKRQIDLIGEKGQKKLKNTTIGIVGVGGIGGPALLSLAYAGIGNFVIIENDRVEISNLNRQMFYTYHDIDRLKVDVVWDRLKEINPDINIKVYNMRLEDMGNPPKVDIWIDGLDNFSARFLLNEIAIKSNTPLIHGGIEEFSGEVMTIIPYKGACLSCLFPSPIKKKENIQVLAPHTMIIGAIMASEALKVILFPEKIKPGIFYSIDLLNLEITQIETEKDPNCPVCGAPKP